MQRNVDKESARRKEKKIEVDAVKVEELQSQSARQIRCMTT